MSPRRIKQNNFAISYVSVLGGREATTGNASALRRLNNTEIKEKKRLFDQLNPCAFCLLEFTLQKIQLA